jgi:hypothetical protein
MLALREPLRLTNRDRDALVQRNLAEASVLCGSRAARLERAKLGAQDIA